MKFEIVQQLLPPDTANRPGMSLHPVGIVIHETADPGATAQNESTFEHTHQTHTSAHYFVDDKTIIQNIPDNEWAYHAGPTANKQFLGIEICHFEGDEEKFQAAWERAVWLTAYKCHGLQITPATNIHSHAWVSEEWHEVDHTDPVGYFAEYSKTMADFVADVEVQLKEIQNTTPIPVTAAGDNKPPSASPEATLPNPLLNGVILTTGYMSIGSSGGHVADLQEVLNYLGVKPALVEDGDFGQNTDKALRAFQKKNGLTADGVYGPQTKAKMEVLIREKEAAVEQG